MKKTRLSIHVRGRVQGVGFRPAVYRYARERKLSGWVRNNSCGVAIEVEGEKKNIDDFLKILESSPPPQAHIEHISTSVLPLDNEEGFRIVASRSESGAETEVSPDIAICTECLKELLDPDDRRYLYPFINCTDCGPRLTIVDSIPYDRKRTTMTKFTMCLDCANEYHSPSSRRFHAQPNACPGCGPQVTLVQTSDFRSQTTDDGHQIAGEQAVKKTMELLQQGRIAAIKGLGGFHLACDALNEAAVRELRARKGRERKPFALMAKNLEVVKQFCEISPEEERLLLSPKRPIVLLKKLSALSSQLSAIFECIAPGNKYLGFMLPYTPLHHLLFSQLPPLNSKLSVLVMTSANTSDEPIVHKNDDAFVKLRGIADYCLLHDRDISIQCDDSVTRVFALTGDEILMRRARGYAPQPIRIQDSEFRIQDTILACGGHLKNTFALARGNEVFISQHIGNLGTFEAYETYGKTIEHFQKLFRMTPSVIACDLHPGYLSTKYAKELTASNPQLSVIGVQHHHAHIASCMADNNLENRQVIGVAFDGTGYSGDGTSWGGEFLVSDYTQFTRVGHLKYMRLPGGEKAIHEPWRMAVSLLYEAYGESLPELDLEFNRHVDREEYYNLKRMLDKGINCPRTSSMGRLFDGVSALLELRESVTYEGEAAILLEMAIKSVQSSESYEYEIEKTEDVYIIDPVQVIRGVVEDLQGGVPVSVISEKFHNTVAEMIVETCLKIRSGFNDEPRAMNHKLNDVALSGGVFQNMFLLDKSCRKLSEKGFHVHIHHRVPPNDGGISLGQAVVASMRKTLNPKH